MSKPGLWTGAWVGLLLTAPLVVVSALGNQLAGLPFIPYDLFPFVRDLTPGLVLTTVIDTMVSAIIAFGLGRVDEAAKVAEQGMAILMLVGVGVVAGALYFAIMKRANTDNLMLSGLLLGLLLGVPLALISHSLGLSARTGSALLNAAWILLLMGVWGLLHAWAYERLTMGATDRTSRTLPA